MPYFIGGYMEVYLDTHYPSILNTVEGLSRISNLKRTRISTKGSSVNVVHLHASLQSDKERSTGVLITTTLPAHPSHGVEDRKILICHQNSLFRLFRQSTLENPVVHRNRFGYVLTCEVGFIIFALDDLLSASALASFISSAPWARTHNGVTSRFVPFKNIKWSQSG